MEQMEFFAFHGCFDEEQVIGNRFLVDLEFETETAKAELSDRLDDTVDYQDVYSILKAEIDVNSKLLEHLSRRILNAVSIKYPFLKNLKIRVSKMSPPIGGKIRAVTLELKD